MLFQAFCKQGRLQILSNGTIQVVTLFFGSVLWSVPREFVTGLSVRHGLFTDTLIIHTTQGQCQADTLIKSVVARVQAFFPHLPLIPLPPPQRAVPIQVRVQVARRQQAKRSSGAARAIRQTSRFFRKFMAPQTTYRITETGEKVRRRIEW